MRGGDGGGSEEQRPQQASAEMEDMMEQMLSMASWNEAQAGGGGGVGARMPHWAAGADYSSIAGLESMVALLNTSNGPASAGHHQLLDPEDSIVVNGAMAAIKSATSSDSRSWQEGVYGGAALNFGGTKGATAATSDTAAAAAALMLGKRIRDQEHPAGSMISGISTGGQAEAIFSSYTGPRVGHIQGSIARTTGRGSNAQFTQALRTAPTTTTTTATSDSDHQQQQQVLGTSQEAVSQQPAARPRVRARRGQATDPHSIAERLRRERIAERMKSLQELVPNANKTDKASMLDEIIDYVKFLQLQVKVLSMSRLGNAGAVSSFMADLPAEESNKFLAALSKNGGSAAQLQQEGGVSLTERQVAKLMEEDMGSAMQYLQSKGLCLMPIHLAGNMSTKAAAGGGGSIMDPKKPTAPLPAAAATAGIAGSSSASRASKFEDSSTNNKCKAEQRPESQQH